MSLLHTGLSEGGEPFYFGLEPAFFRPLSRLIAETAPFVFFGLGCGVGGNSSGAFAPKLNDVSSSAGFFIFDGEICPRMRS